MGYLKALGLFRIVAEQAAPDARLSWRGGGASVDSRLGPDDLVRLFLEAYVPTAIVAPWNGASGFYGTAQKHVDALAASTTTRLAPYRDTIARVRSFVPATKPKEEAKSALLARCRSELDDHVVPWLDVCYVLGENRPGYFPLLGTGGNDGRLDFTANFMQRLEEVLPFHGADPRPRSEELLRAALFAEGVIALGKSAIGQFDPGGVGGPNGTQGRFEADARVNPWDYVLMLEGTLLLAGSTARRLGTRSASRSVFPFSVESVAVGYGSAAGVEETTDGSRAELWLPLWDGAATLSEVRHLFAEGRAQVGRRQARNAIEFALATNLLGVNRGVRTFVRYGFLKRNGLAFLAAGLGRLDVRNRPQARLLQDPPLVAWLDSFRRACAGEDAPDRYRTALRQVDRAIFSCSGREQAANAALMSDVLIALGRAQRVLATGWRFASDKHIRPLQGLSPQWLQQADDGSPEFRLSMAVAGIGSRPDGVGPLRTFVDPVVAKRRSIRWDPGSSSAVWTNRPLAANLAAVLLRRQVEASRQGVAGAFHSSPRPARIEDVLAFLHGAVDDQRLAGLLLGLLALDWPAVESALVPSDRPDRRGANRLPFEFGVLRLLTETIPIAASGDRWSFASQGERVLPEPDLMRRLVSGQRDAVGLAVDRAARRLASAGLAVCGHRYGSRAGRALGVTSAIPPERLLASMIFPLPRHDMEWIANQVLYPPAPGHEE